LALEGIIGEDDIDYKRAVENRHVAALNRVEALFDQRGARVKKQFENGYLISEGGIHCPICGGSMGRRSLICRHCRRAGRLHVDASKVQAVTKEVYLPRAIGRQHLSHSA
jgi:hypothetical protein